MKAQIGRIVVTGHAHPYRPDEIYRKLTKVAWGKKYRSMDNGATWHRTSSEAFWAAFHAGKLETMPADDVQFIANGGLVLA